VHCFYYADSKSAKKTDDLTVFFALLGSAHPKAAGKHVGEINPLLQFLEVFLPGLGGPFTCS